MIEPDYTNYTFDELLDVAGRINRSEFPERYGKIEEEIARRYRLRDELSPPVGRRPVRGEAHEPGGLPPKALPSGGVGASISRRSGERVIRIIAGVEIAVGCLDIIRLMLRGWNPLLVDSMVSVTAISAALSILAGVLLWGYRKSGVTISIILFLLQIPFIYTRSLGLYAIDTVFSIQFKLGSPGTDGQGYAGFIGVNVMAVGTLFLVARYGSSLGKNRLHADPDDDDGDGDGAV